MIRTTVAAPSVWPQTNALTRHAWVVQSFLTITTGPSAACNLFVQAEHHCLVIREEGSWSTRISAQLKTAMFVFLSIPQVSKDKKRNGIYALHRHIIFVDWTGDHLAAELAVWGRSAQIINFDNDTVPERSRGRGCVGVGGGRHLEAASASTASATAGTVCERIDRSRVPIHFLATRCGENVELSEFQGVIWEWVNDLPGDEQLLPPLNDAFHLEKPKLWFHVNLTLLTILDIFNMIHYPMLKIWLF